MRSILITGCNRGLGLGLIKHLVKETNPPETVIATCRNLQKAEELRQIASEHKNVNVLEFDVQNFDRYDEFGRKVENLVGENGLNVLYNNAGFSTKFTRIQFVKLEQMIESFNINTVAPVLLSKTLLPLLKKASNSNSNKPLGSERGLIINMSSILGSVALNKDGGFYPYRCSKAALNMVTKSLSADLRKDGILAISLHPGWVKTDMGGANAPMQIEESVSSIIKFLKSVNETYNGGFYQWDGSKLDW